jgi:hypothetical protein
MCLHEEDSFFFYFKSNFKKIFFVPTFSLSIPFNPQHLLKKLIKLFEKYIDSLKTKSTLRNNLVSIKKKEKNKKKKLS